MKKIGLGIIGLGYIGKVHLRSSSVLESVELVAVSDLSKKALNLARRAGVKRTYSDYQQLLKGDNIDAVIIALPTHLHVACAREAAESGKHILLEKPLARNVEEGEEIVSAVEKNNIKLMVGYPYRFASPFESLKEKIETGELGEVQMAYATNIASGPFLHRTESDAPAPVPDWWFQKELTGGGALIDLGSHMINLVRWYLGEVSDVKSSLGYRYNLDLEDQATCLIRFQSGQNAILNVGWFSQQNQLKVELLGTVSHSSSSHAAPSRVRTAVQLMMRRPSPYYLPHRRELSHFVQCIEEDKQPLTPAEDALKDLKAIELAYKNEIHLS